MVIPVVLFVYNRPDTTSEVVSALKNQTLRPELVLVFSDGARCVDDQSKVKNVRQIISRIDWTDFKIEQREENIGCATNIIQGLDQVFHDFESAVILEDDVKPARHFYESMTLLLDRYANEAQIFSVGGYPSIKEDALQDYPYDVIHSPRFNAWGWGTWRDRWRKISPELHDFQCPYSQPDDVPSHAGYDLPQTVNYFTEHPGFYWDIPIALISLSRGLMHALTKYYLVRNIGFESGMHGHGGRELRRFIERHNQICENLPIRFPPSTELQEDVNIAIQDYINSVSGLDQQKRNILRITRTRLGKIHRRIRQYGKHS